MSNTTNQHDSFWKYVKGQPGWIRIENEYKKANDILLKGIESGENNWEKIIQNQRLKQTVIYSYNAILIYGINSESCNRLEKSVKRFWNKLNRIKLDNPN